MNTQDKIKTQIVAFLFNKKADVLRGELYRALLLHVLNDIGIECHLDEIIEAVGYAIGQKVVATDSFRTIILDELSTLVKREEVQFIDGKYKINEAALEQLPDEKAETEINTKIFEEIKAIGLTINNYLSKPQIEKLFKFFLYICQIIANERMTHVAKSGKLEINYTNFDELRSLATQARTDYQVDKILDAELFIEKCFTEPSPLLSTYVFTLIQVNLIIQLLAWDPALEKLQDTVLKGKILYLDTSILFAIMQETHPMHEFIRSVLIASKEELGVTIRVHENTIEEYNSVMRFHSDEFNAQQNDLRRIAQLAKQDNIDPGEFLDNNIFVDYLSLFPNHVDLGSWQRYQNDVGVDGLRKTLMQLKANIDNRNAFVPTEKFNIIKGNMLRASIDQARRGKRSTGKSDVTHDVQMYYLLEQIRKKPKTEYAFGYDTYLLTLDGSLTYFSKYQGITWVDTYFIFPSQWYEISFPFLRMKINQNPQVAHSFSTVAFSALFTKLEALIPLHIFGYVFSHGGENLSLTSIKSIVEALHNERLEERLNPANKNIRQREEAGLRIERMIAQEVIREKQILSDLKTEEDNTKRNIERQKDELNALTQKTTFQEAIVSNLDTQLQSRKNIDDIYRSTQDIRIELEEKFKKEKAEIEAESQAKLAAVVEEVYKKLEEDKKEEREKELQRIAARLEMTKKIVITIIMILATMVSTATMYYLEVNLVIYILSIFLMVVGIGIYRLAASPWWSFIIFGIGILLTTWYLLTTFEFDSWLWTIPMAWEILIFGVERLYPKK